MKHCPKCHKEANEDDDYCGECGEKLKHIKEHKEIISKFRKKTIFIVLGAIIFLIIILIILSNRNTPYEEIVLFRSLNREVVSNVEKGNHLGFQITNKFDINAHNSWSITVLDLNTQYAKLRMSAYPIGKIAFTKDRAEPSEITKDKEGFFIYPNEENLFSLGDADGSGLKITVTLNEIKDGKGTFTFELIPACVNQCGYGGAICKGNGQIYKCDINQEGCREEIFIDICGMDYYCKDQSTCISPSSSDIFSLNDLGNCKVLSVKQGVTMYSCK